MPIIFSDEDLMYLDKEQDNQLSSIRQAIDTMRAKNDASFCKKCGHIMQYFTVGMQSFFNVVSVGTESLRW